MSSKLDGLLDLATHHNQKLSEMIDQAAEYNGPFAATIKKNPMFSKATDLAMESGMLITALSAIVKEQRKQLSQGGIDGEQGS